MQSSIYGRILNLIGQIFFVTEQLLYCGEVEKESERIKNGNYRC